jgi:hypothetical protein
VRVPRLGSLVVVCALAACRTGGGPEHVAERYARALEKGDLTEAYELTSGEYRARTRREEFEKRFAEEETRRDRASEIRAALPSLTAEGKALELRREGDDWRVDEAVRGPRTSSGEAAAALRRFVDAVERRDFETAYGLLSGPLRARYTPERFEHDFAAEPLAKERLERARRAAMTAPVAVAGGFSFPIGGDKAVRVVREGDGYRVAAIE